MADFLQKLSSLAPLAGALGVGSVITHFVSRKYPKPDNDTAIPLLNEACKKKSSFQMQAYFKKLTGCTPPHPDIIQFLYNSQEPFNGMMWYAKGNKYCTWQGYGFKPKKLTLYKLFYYVPLIIGLLILISIPLYSMFHYVETLSETIVFLVSFLITSAIALPFIYIATNKLLAIYCAEKLCSIRYACNQG